MTASWDAQVPDQLMRNIILTASVQRVLDVLVPEIGLKGAGIVSLRRKCEPEQLTPVERRRRHDCTPYLAVPRVRSDEQHHAPLPIERGLLALP